MQVLKKTAIGFCLAATLLSYSSCQKDDNNKGNVSIAFEQQFGSTELMEYADVKQTDDGGFLLLGTIDADDVTSDKRDIYVVKTDSDGNQEWAKKYGTTNSQGYNYDEEGVKLVKISSTEYLVAGNQNFYKNNVIEKTKIVLYKIDANGNVIGNDIILRNGGTEAAFSEEINDIKADGTDFILTGKTSNVFPNKPGGTQTGDIADILVMKLDNQLQRTWAQEVSGFDKKDEGLEVMVKNGSYVVISTVQEGSHQLNTQLHIASYEKTRGAMLSTRRYGQSGEYATVRAATINPADEVITILGEVTTGTAAGDLLLLQVDNMLDNKTAVKATGSDFMLFGNVAGNMTAALLQAGDISYLSTTGGFVISYTDVQITTNDLGILKIDPSFNIEEDYPKVLEAKGVGAKAGAILPIVVENNGNTVVDSYVLSATLGTTRSQQLGIFKLKD